MLNASSSLKQLKIQEKRTDTKTIIQAYHDGVGNIKTDGGSKLIDEENEAAKSYYPKVKSFYDLYSNVGIA